MLVILILLVYLAIAIIVARALIFNDILPHKKPSDNKHLLDDYDIQDFSFSNKNNKTLHGWFIRANNNPDNKTLLVLHEWLGSRLSIIEQIRFFVDHGYNVVTYDQRSHGDSDKDIITYGAEE